MQMFVLALPSSIAVGELLNSMSPDLSRASEGVVVFASWVPFFLVGVMQWVFVLGTLRLARSRRIEDQSSDSPAAHQR
jgi:hypothetical protein